MTSRDFCFWLQGYFELGDAPRDTLNTKQVEVIRRHLALVFVHEIDPSMGDSAEQAKLNAVHMTPEQVEALKKRLEDLEKRPTPGGFGPNAGGDLVMRC